MTGFSLILGVVALVAVIVADFVIRLVLAPHRRDEWTAALLDSLIKPMPKVQRSGMFPASVAMDETLCESLLRHFEQSTATRQILGLLSEQSDGMNESEVRETVNRRLAESESRELPAAAIRRIALILKNAGLVSFSQRRLKLTVAGQRLHALLEARASVSAEPAGRAFALLAV